MIEDNHTAAAYGVQAGHIPRGEAALGPAVVRALHHTARERRQQEPAYFSAFAALAGSLIGGLTSLTASWLTQHVQFQAQQRASDLSRRQELYKAFIEEASRWYADAFVHDTADVANLVNLYALASQMRVLSSPQIVASADHVR